MGVTYKAYDPQLRLDIALKVINPAQVGDAKARALFLREARAAARVHHANVGNVVYLNQDPENMFYAMEFIAGESLRDWLHSRVPLSPLMAVELSAQIARGLGAIHREDIVHRDLKPTNLMVVRADKERPESDPEAWQIKIIDFGLARHTAGDVSESTAAANTTGFRGTALYASPEQCEERRDLDGRSDLYSLGCVMWEMLVGTPPFRAKIHREVLNAHVAKPPPMQQISHLPPSLQAVVARLLLKDRDARFKDAGATVRALEKCREQILRGDASEVNFTGPTDEAMAATTVLPSAATPTSNKPRPAKRRVMTAALTAFFVLSGLLGWKTGWFSRAAKGDSEALAWNAPTVAILPFEAVDGGKEENRLADALTTETIDRVSRLPGTRAISRGAVLPFKIVPGGPARKRVRAIDAELGGVSAILEASVERQGDNLKINTILYDAKTEQRLWGYTYNRSWNDATSAEKEVPDQIARALRTRFDAAKRETPAQRTAGGSTAADLYFQALPLDPSDANRKALLDQAIAKDPKFAEAYAESSLYEFTFELRDPPPTEKDLADAIKRGEDLNRKALALDPDCVAALVHLSAFRGLAGAAQEENALLDRGLLLGPNFMRANLFAGFRAKSPDEAYAYVRRAHAIAPEIRRVMFFLLDKASAYHLPELEIHWLKEINAVTSDLQMRNLNECEQLIVRGDFSGALDRLKLFPPELHKDHFSVAELTFRALRGARKYEEALAQLDKIKPDGRPAFFRDLDRAELLLQAGRPDEARQVAERFLKTQTEYIEKSKAANDPVSVGYFRCAKALEILEKPAEAVAMLDQFAQSNSGAEPFPDRWLFRNNPAALERLEKLGDRGVLIAKRILEIERSYTSPAAEASPR